MPRPDRKNPRARRRPIPAFDRLEGRALLNASQVIPFAPFHAEISPKLILAATTHHSKTLHASKAVHASKTVHAEVLLPIGQPASPIGQPASPISQPISPIVEPTSPIGSPTPPVKRPKVPSSPKVPPHVTKHCLLYTSPITARS